MDTTPNLATSPQPTVDDAVAEVWERILDVPAHRNDRLLDALVNESGVVCSRQLGRLLSEITIATGVHLPLTIVYESPTAAELADMIRSRDWPRYERPIRIRSGVGRNLFVLPGIGGIGLDILRLMRHLTFSGSVYLNPPRGVDGTQPDRTLDDVVADQLAAIRAVQPTGPYWLLGYSWGGLVAMEISRVLRASGETIAFLGMIDPVLDQMDWTYRAWLEYTARRIGHHLKELGRTRSLNAAFRLILQQPIQLIDRVARLFGFYGLWDLATEGDDLPPPLAAVWKTESEIIQGYRVRYYDGSVTLFASRSGHAADCDPKKVWPPKVRQLDLQWVPGDHLLTEPTVKDLAGAISVYMERIPEPVVN